MCNMTAYPGKVRRNNKLSDRSDLSDLSDLLPAGLRGIRQIFLYFLFDFQFSVLIDNVEIRDLDRRNR